MKIFISWSGELSKKIAEILTEWLPSVIQLVKPYYSPDDIIKGTRWNSEIAKELNECSLGIICLTKENLNSSWIMFEAGALSKNIDNSKVCPILFGIDPIDVQGPLVQFQAAKFGKGEIKKVLKMINQELGESGLRPEIFESTFKVWWPSLTDKIDEQMKNIIDTSNVEVRTERAILEEILTLSRTMSIAKENTTEIEDSLPREVTEALINAYRSVVAGLSADMAEEVWKALYRIDKNLRYVLKHTALPRTTRYELQKVLDYGLNQLETYRRLPLP